MKTNIIADGRQLVLLASPDERDRLSMYEHPERLSLDAIKRALDLLLGQNGLEWREGDTLSVCRIGGPQLGMVENSKWVYLGRFPDTDGEPKKWFARITDAWTFEGSPSELLLQLRDQGQAIFNGGAI